MWFRSLQVAGLSVAAMLVAACSAMVGVACGSFDSAGDTGAADATTMRAADGGTPSSDGGGASDGGGTSPDGTTGAPDATNPTDPGVFCGAAGSCNPQTQVCCTHIANSSDEGCIPAATRTACGGADLSCDDGADCASNGGVCCGFLGSDGTDILRSTCVTLMNCKTETSWVVVCDPMAPQACPGGVGCHVPDGGAYGLCDGLVHP